MPSSIQCLSPWCCRAGRIITSAVAVHQSLASVCVCVSVKGIAAGCRAARRSLSSLMRLHCPNLTANPIVMLCTLVAEGAARPGLCSTEDPLVWCLLEPQRRGWWICLGLGASVTIRRGEGSPSGRRRAPLAGSRAQLLARCPARTAGLFSAGLCNCFVPK